MNRLLVCALALGSACDTRPGLGDPCRFGCEGYVGACTPEVHDCADGLTCSELSDLCIRPSAIGAACGEGCESGAFCGSDGLCQALGQLGEPCGERCADGLACAIDGRCAERGGDGAACDSDDQCGELRACSLGAHGQVIEGACLAPQPEGGPCTWAPVGATPDAPDPYWRLTTGARIPFVYRGCDSGLVCAPDPELPAPGDADLDPARLGCTNAEACGYRGTCRAPGSVAFEGPCLDDATCEGARCALTTAPRALSPASGFVACDASPLVCWDGPWPGHCADVRTSSPAGSGCVGPNARCDPGLACVQSDPSCVADCQATCQPQHQLPSGAACGEPDCHLIDDGAGHLTCESAARTLVPVDAMCALGLRCDGTRSPPTCVP